MDFDVIVTAEHASNHVPDGVNLGVTREVLESHVAWDPGTKRIAEMMSRALNAPLLMGEATRLLVDLNRSPTNPEAVPEIAFGVPVPGNQGLTHAERSLRIARYQTPYWEKARELVRARVDHRPVLHLSIHSFTPVLFGEERPMSVGVMFDPGRPIEQNVADAFIAALRRRNVHTAENGPYDGRNDALVTSLRTEFPVERYIGIQIEHSLKHMPDMAPLGELVVAAVREGLALSDT